MNNIQRSKALIKAVFKDDYEQAHALLVAGANPNFFEDHACIRPLHMAVQNQNEAMVKLLLSFGANPLAESIDAYTPVMMANMQQNKAIQRLLEDSEGVDVASLGGDL